MKRVSHAYSAVRFQWCAFAFQGPGAASSSSTPYTFRSAGLPPGSAVKGEMADFLYRIGVDALFTECVGVHDERVKCSARGGHCHGRPGPRDGP